MCIRDREGEVRKQERIEQSFEGIEWSQENGHIILAHMRVNWKENINRIDR